MTIQTLFSNSRDLMKRFKIFVTGSNFLITYQQKFSIWILMQKLSVKVMKDFFKDKWMKNR